MLKSPPSTSGNSPAQRARCRRPVASRIGPPAWTFATHVPALCSRTACSHRRSGEMHRRRTGARRSRRAAHEDRVGAAAAGLDRVRPADRDRAPDPQAGVSRGEDEALVGIQTRRQQWRPPGRDLLKQRHIPFPAAERARRTRRTGPGRRGHRAPVHEVPREHACDHWPNVHSALAAPLHHRVGADRCGAERADRRALSSRQRRTVRTRSVSARWR